MRGEAEIDREKEGRREERGGRGKMKGGGKHSCGSGQTDQQHHLEPC